VPGPEDHFVGSSRCGIVNDAFVEFASKRLYIQKVEITLNLPVKDYARV
jgi:hypothetical protein